MQQRRKMIGEILVESRIISEEQLAEALVEQRKTGQKIGQFLVSKGILTEQQLVETLERILGIPQVQLSRINIDPETLKLLTPQLIRKHKALPISRRGNMLTVAMSDPLNQEAIDDVQMATGMDVSPVLVSDKDIDTAIRQNLAFRIDPFMERALEEIRQESRATAATQARKEATPQIRVEDDAPVVRMVNAILRQAVHARASDIHIEPLDDMVRLRFRIDGELYEVTQIPKNALNALVSRLKIMSNMDIAERRVPQDGRIGMQLDNRDIDFRVSTLPTGLGEKVVLRILDRSNTLTEINQLNLSARNRERLVALSHLPHGMVLVTGPTGSGKTTTLYSVLGDINTIEKNIITLEDPIEYTLEGINQVQTNPKAGLTFASGLRSVLRQDPDVIMVGEIRDSETAALGVQASLTGHLVLSTLHTNSAAGAIARLSDMNIEEFLISAALSGVVAQRLVRKLCKNCRTPYVLEEDIAVKIGIPEHSGERFYAPGGCQMCRMQGYTGRMAIHEIMVLGSDMRSFITQGGVSEDIIEKVAVEEGMLPMKIDGIQKAREGLTTLEEVIKVVLLS